MSKKKVARALRRLAQRLDPQPHQPIPADELAREQGIHGPQGLEAVGDPDWADDEHDRAFLAYVLGGHQTR